ncbi:methyltransferase domain-containing protein, partial [Psychrobacter immobilis]
IYLYAGDVPKNEAYQKFIGLSLTQSNFQHIKHDITEIMPLPDQCVDIYQAEDVFEHIQLDEIPNIINEIYRVLKKGGVFRLSVPDYRCDLLENRTVKDDKGELIFDPLGGGNYENGKVVGGGHIWFPKYETVKELLSKTKFNNINFLHYYDESGEAVTKPIDYSIGYVMRTPDNDERVSNPYRPMSIVVDCIKQ